MNHYGRTWVIWPMVCGLLLWFGYGCTTPPAVQPQSKPAPSKPPLPTQPMVPPKPLVPPQTKPGDTSRPTWVVGGSGVYITEGKRVFYGVGQAGGISHRSLLRATTDNRARSEMGTLLQTYMEALLQKAASGRVNPETTQSVRALTGELLKKSIIKTHWNDVGQGKLYGLCSFDLKTLKLLLKNSSQIEEPLRSKMVEFADQQHAAMVRVVP